MGRYTLKGLKKRFDANDMTLEEAAYIAGELLHENAVLDGELLKAQNLVCKACTTGEDGSPVKYGEFDGEGNYILPKELPNVPSLEDRCKHLEAQLTAEEQCAMESGGLLSDVCDLVFDDPERAAIHGYEGVHNKIAEIKNRLRLYQIQIDKYCGADNVGCDGFCAGCPLGKCGVNNGEKTKTKSL